ncbi:MAG: tyrosine-type recombinase/integrase [Acidobacteriaceae bacterium]
MEAPVITIFVRHGMVKGKPCKWSGEEFTKKCRCPKHLRWSANGKQFRRKTGTRSWEEAEKKKRELEDQLAGRDSSQKTEVDTRDLQTCIDVFIQDKQVRGVTADVIGKYTRELSRLRDHCEMMGVYTVQGITRELLTGFCVTWEQLYPSTQTRGAVRTRCRGFLRYCYEAQWLARIPALPKIQVDEPETLPLTQDEFDRLLKAVAVFPDPARRQHVRALFQLMRWSGLAVRDALTLPKAALRCDGGIYRVTTNRTKTGTHVSVPVPPKVAEEILAVTNEGEYIFWDGRTDIVKTWTKYMIAPAFKAAKITSDGYMVSHRLRDTFAVDLLEKGVPMEEVSRLLGHTSIKTTEKSYAKWSKGRQDRVDALVTGTWSTAQLR